MAPDDLGGSSVITVLLAEPGSNWVLVALLAITREQQYSILPAMFAFRLGYTYP